MLQTVTEVYNSVMEFNFRWACSNTRERAVQVAFMQPAYSFGEGRLLKVWRMPMARARTSKRNTRKKVAPALGVAGLSLAMAGGASASTAGSAVDVPVQDTAMHHELFLGEEEISDVSLSTFYVFDKENTSTSLAGFEQVAWGCRCGCRGCRCGFRACRCGWRWGCGGCGGCGGCCRCW